MTTAIIVQARMASTRLPGKVLAPVLGRPAGGSRVPLAQQIPLLAHQIRRLQRSRLADNVIVATTTSPTDDAIVNVAAIEGAGYCRGSERDVLSRYIEAAREFDVSTIIRSTADCPLIDPAYVDLLIAQFQTSGADYGWLGDHPGGIPNGMGAEAIRLETLEAIYPHTTPEEREHVTLYVRRRPAEFRMMSVETGLGLDDERWTVDDPRDLELIRRIIEALYPLPFTLQDIRRVLAEHPEWRALNADVPMTAMDRSMLQAAAFAPWLGDL